MLEEKLLEPTTSAALFGNRTLPDLSITE